MPDGQAATRSWNLPLALTPLATIRRYQAGVTGERSSALAVGPETGGGRDFRTRLTVIVTFGAILRMRSLGCHPSGTAPLMLNDSLYYSLQARQLAHGVWFRELFVDQPGAEHGPLTSTLMAVVSWGDIPSTGNG